MAKIFAGLGTGQTKKLLPERSTSITGAVFSAAASPHKYDPAKKRPNYTGPAVSHLFTEFVQPPAIRMASPFTKTHQWSSFFFLFFFLSRLAQRLTIMRCPLNCSRTHTHGATIDQKLGSVSLSLSLPLSGRNVCERSYVLAV